MIMSELDAWHWVESHECFIHSQPDRIILQYHYKWYYSTNPDAGMHIIECVQQAIKHEQTEFGQTR